VIIAAIGFFLLPAGINVTEITYQSPDNACGLAGSDWDGFTANESQVIYIGFNLTGPMNSSTGNTSACTISTVSTSTPGFSISGANVPLAIPKNSNETLEFNITCPNSSFSGVLTLTVT
jgi:hypothetical protein